MRRHNFGRIFRFLLVLLGNCLYALTVKLFLLPAGLISTGTTGIALTVNHLTGFPMPVFILLFNLLMLGLGWWILGRQFALTTVFSSLFYPLALEGLNHLLGDPLITDNLLPKMLALAPPCYSPIRSDKFLSPFTALNPTERLCRLNLCPSAHPHVISRIDVTDKIFS